MNLPQSWKTKAPTPKSLCILQILHGIICNYMKTLLWICFTKHLFSLRFVLQLVYLTDTQLCSEQRKKVRLSDKCCLSRVLIVGERVYKWVKKTHCTKHQNEYACTLSLASVWESNQQLCSCCCETHACKLIQ